MFWSTHSATEKRKELRELEAQMSHLRLRQAVIVNDLDKINAAGRDGHRSINEWLSAEIDVSRSSASELVFCGRHLAKYRPVNYRLAEGQITFDRAVGLMRLADAGADRTTIEAAEGMDLAGVKRLIAQQRRVTRRDEQQAAQERFAMAQPNLDESAWRISGVLPGVDGQIFYRALDERSDELRRLPGGDQYTRGQLQADALVAMAHDSLSRNSDQVASNGGSVTVFVNLDQANRSGGEHGATIAYGPRVGPDTLEELLCTGQVQIIGLENGDPVVASTATRAIPPAIRRLVAARDGGCTIAGCTSRYRLEPHHIVLRSDGGSHDPDNLTTLCWFHHHVAIHQQGLRIDPDSPPLKRRLIRPQTDPDPPSEFHRPW